MSVLTTIQVKRIAAFLKASSAQIPQHPSSPKLGQWLDIISRESGFRDWNAMSASVNKRPVLSKENSTWPNGLRTFFGIARVLISDKAPTHHLTWFGNRELTGYQAAITLADSIRPHLAPSNLGLRFRYSRPDVKLPDGQISASWTNRAQGCPIVITSDDQKITILLWWLSEHYQLPENRPTWAQDSPSHYVNFDSAGDAALHVHDEDELNDSLTDVVLTHLTSRAQPRRTCLFVPQWPASSEPPISLLVEEGNPNAEPVEKPLGTGWSELRAAAKAYNTERGLSSIDCSSISARYEFAERQRNEEDYTEFSGIHDD